MRLLRNRVAALYLWAVVIVSIVVLPFIWYVSHVTFLAFQDFGSELIQDLGTNSTTSDGVEMFFANADKYLLVIALIGVGLWAWAYSQKRGVPLYEP